MRTVAQLREALASLPDDAIVILSDAEGNRIWPWSGLCQQGEWSDAWKEFLVEGDTGISKGRGVEAIALYSL